MEHKVMDIVRSYFSNEVVGFLSVKFKAEEEKVRLALRHTMPIAVNGLVTLGQQENQSDIVGRLAYEAAAAGLPHDVSVLSNTDWAARSSALMENLLAEAYGMTQHCLSAASSVRPVEGETILGYTLALTLGALGQYALKHNLQEFELLAWMLGQKAEIREAVPAYSRKPLPMPPAKKAPVASPANPPAVVPMSSAAGSLAGNSQEGSYIPVAKSKLSKTGTALRWQLGGLALLAAGLGYFIGHDPEPEKAEVANEAPTAVLTSSPVNNIPANNTGPNSSRDARPTGTRTPKEEKAVISGRYYPATDTYIYYTGKPTTLRLPDGTVLKVGSKSTESQLYQFLSDPKMQVDSVNRTKGWINCDRIYFEPSKAILTEGSSEQLRNIASILRAYPTARIKFGGYTDSTGNALKNYQLSENRAKSAMLALGSIGIDIGRIEAKGYGGKFFLTSNLTPEGRAINRRVSIRVLKK